MKDLSLRHVLFVLPIALAAAAAIFIAYAGSAGGYEASPAPPAADMNVPF